MSEQYRFMRYYLPGSLFLAYLMTLIVLNLSPTAINSLNWEKIIGALLGALGASPIVGYLIYAIYNSFVYEHLARRNRPALKYIEDLKFVKENRVYYQKQLKCFLQKKEFLDLIYHSTLVESNKDILRIGPEILKTLKGHLSNFAARFVCGLLVPFFLVLFWFPVKCALELFGVSFTPRPPFIFWTTMTILIISFVLLWDCKRVLYEAYQLEAYFIRAKRKEIEELLKRLFTSQKPK